MIFPLKTSIYGWDFPVRYVSHNQMVNANPPLGPESALGLGPKGCETRIESMEFH